jgi:DNA polymerase-3 subunit delta
MLGRCAIFGLAWKSFGRSSVMTIPLAQRLLRPPAGTASTRDTGRRNAYIVRMPAPDTEKALRKAIRAHGPFEPVYYLHGADDYLKEDALRDLLASAVDPATRDFNLDIRSAADLGPEALGSLLGTPPMMAERRVVVLRDVQAMKKDARNALEHYLAQPAPDLMLVMVAPAGESKKSDDDLRARACPVEFAPLGDDRLPKWIAHHAREEHGAEITAQACAMLHSIVGNDLPTLAGEIDKLASYASGKAIDEDAVSAVVGVRRGETLADLLDRVAQRDAAGALAVLPHVMEQPKMGGVPIVMALTAQMQALGYGAALRAGGTSSRVLESEYWKFLKSGGSVMTGRPWGEAVKAWVRDVERWNVVAVDRALELLYDADIALKDTRVSSEDRVVATTILALCALATAT